VKVLIVDDEEPARERLRQILQDEDDYEVVGDAGNGHDALLLAAKHEPDIVLLDIRMPGLDGIETAQHLNELEHTPAVVFTTAYDEYAVDAFEARAVGYVLKPVRRSRLAAALAQASRLAGTTLRQVAADANLETPTRMRKRRGQPQINSRRRNLGLSGGSKIRPRGTQERPRSC
jgi:two-component system response regulator AlgR